MFVLNDLLENNATWPNAFWATALTGLKYTRQVFGFRSHFRFLYFDNVLQEFQKGFRGGLAMVISGKSHKGQRLNHSV